MKRLKRAWLGLGLGLALVLPISGCSGDVREISDIALVMITGIDYDTRTNDFVFTMYCIHAASNGAENSPRELEWIASARGKTLFEAGRNLRSRAGKILVWQHDKFFLVGENAARHVFYEIIDFLSRSREFRMSSYLIVTEGDANDKIKTESETGDLMANEIVGKIKNEKLWGRSLSLTLKDVVNTYTNPYRAFVTGKLSKSKPVNSTRKVLFLSGGSVVNRGKLVGWLSGNDVLSIHIMTKKKDWRNTEFSASVPYNSATVSILMKVTKRSLHYTHVNGKPAFDVRIRINGTIKGTDSPLNVLDPQMYGKLEQAAGKYMENQLKGSLSLFQKDLKMDVVGFSDIVRRYHPNEWRRMEKTWTADIYPAMPIRVHVDVAIPTLGMSEVLGGPSHDE